MVWGLDISFIRLLLGEFGVIVFVMFIKIDLLFIDIDVVDSDGLYYLKFLFVVGRFKVFIICFFIYFCLVFIRVEIIELCLKL